jgi:hypothetical protein
MRITDSHGATRKFRIICMSVVIALYALAVLAAFWVYLAV